LILRASYRSKEKLNLKRKIWDKGYNPYHMKGKLIWLTINQTTIT
jgi:hypothetical protein